VGKLGLAGTSLTAAIPGGILFYLLLMVVLEKLGTPIPMVMKVAILMLLGLSLVMALFPAYLLIWFRRHRPQRAKSPVAAAGIAGADLLADDELPEDLVGQEFAEDDELQAPLESSWDEDSGEVGEVTDSIAVDEVLTGSEEDHLEEDHLETVEFEADEQLFMADEFENDEFGNTIPDADLSGEAREEAEDEFDFGEVAEDGESLLAETAEEFDILESEEDFTPAADFEDEFTFEDFDIDEDDDQQKST